MKGKEKTLQLTIYALFIAILTIQTFVPVLGYLPLGPIQVTIIQITVIVGAILFGPKTGILLGGCWGGLRLIKAALEPNILSAVFLNPMVSLLPRLLTGLVAGVAFKTLNRYLTRQKAAFWTGLLGSLTNTVLFLMAVYLFAADAYAKSLGIPKEGLLLALATVAGTNGVLELIASGILVPLLVKPLAKIID
ncbi:hypothetical protein AWM75_04975 [Aerococcus urinaehominis]|uniref:Uncharacterized protein n=1 Tax=Aerococcus urinaehominis TaxID=128944 RepID=A0A120IAW7_9LACT|nr:ECF transporter S component [Aerococcus urinaehominis]AMB99383.1 hypothetical protein AWM75_04975 [Aerococcus urinaehominis]SDM23247.1 Uncharacterized membrane protein [Aerococcus urinaehominis]